MDPNDDYVVHYDSDQGSMQFLYDLTNIFLRPVIKDDIFPENLMDEIVDCKFWNEDCGLFSLEFLNENIGDILDQNKKFFAAVAFGIVFCIIRFKHESYVNEA